VTQWNRATTGDTVVDAWEGGAVSDAQGHPGGRWSAPRWHYPEYPPGSVIEIRVHGVGGEPPSSMARDADPILVGGDDLAGFHRARNPVVGTVETTDAGGREGASSNGGGPTTNGDPPPRPRRRRALHVREVLAWGGQTSGTVRHALWVLLLPFALFNVAGRMHVTGSAERARRQRAACRVLALSLTLSVVALTSGLALDLIAVQCGAAGEACLGGSGSGRLLLAPFRRFGDDVIGRLGVAALAPALVIVALWYSGRYGTRRLEWQESTGTSASERAGGEPTSLADADFWRNAWPASRLRGLHATAGFAWIAGSLALSSHLVLVDLAEPGATVTSAWLVLAGIAAVTVLGCVILVARPATAIPGQDRRVHLAVTSLRALGLGSLGLGVGAALFGRLMLPDEGPVPTVFGVALWPTLCVVAGVLALAWWAVGTRGRPLHRDWGPTSAFAPADGEVPNVSITSANAGLAVGSVLLGAAATSRSPGSIVRDAYTAPSAEQLAGLPTALHSSEGVLPGLFPGPYLPLIGLVALQVALVLALGLLAAWRPGPPKLREDRSALDRGSPVPRDLTPVVVALLSTLLVTAVGAGLHALVVDWLGSNVAAAELGAAGDVGVELVAPWWYGLTALVVAATPIVGGVAWVVLARRRRRDQPTDDEVAAYLTTAYDRAHLPSPSIDDDRLGEVGAAWMTQRIVRDAGPLLAWTVGILTLSVCLSFVWLGTRDDGFGGSIPLVSFAMWVVVAIPIVAVGLIRSSLSDRGRRREVGRLWDVLTFWPRVTHPFAPPCYGEALVPMLEDRVRLLLGATGDEVNLDDPPSSASSPSTSPPASPSSSPSSVPVEPLQRNLGYRVILAGHSQGSVVALAVAARLEAEEGPAAMRRVALVSYGSPIAILYERYFRATARRRATACCAAPTWSATRRWRLWKLGNTPSTTATRTCAHTSDRWSSPVARRRTSSSTACDEEPRRQRRAGRRTTARTPHPVTRWRAEAG
jgi:hypothetical protein